MAQIVELQDEELHVRKPLPPEINNFLCGLWSAIGTLVLALAALLPMMVYDWQSSEWLSWAGALRDWLGWLSALVLSIVVATLGGIGTLLASKARPRGLTWTRISAIIVLVLGVLLSAAVLVLVIQGQFNLGPTPILAGTLLTVLGLLPVFLSGLTLSLTAVEGVHQFFYPPEEVPAPAEEEVAVEEAIAGVSEEDLERSLGELPTGESAAPPIMTAGEVVRAELGESRIIRAQLDTEAAEIIRAELDDERLVRAELDEDRLVHAEPASAVLPSAGPTSDILEAPSSRASIIPAEIDIERIGDTSSRIFDRSELAPESPSVVLLTSLEPPSTPSGIVSKLVEATPSMPIPESQPPASPDELSEVPAGPTVSAPAEQAAQLSGEPAGETAEPTKAATAGDEEIFSATAPPPPRSETSAIDLQDLAQLEFAPADHSEPETPVYLPSGEPIIVAEQQTQAPTSGEATPPRDSPVPSASESQAAKNASDLLIPETSDQGKDLAHGVEQTEPKEVALFPELGDALPPLRPPETKADDSTQPTGNPPSDELFRDVNSPSKEEHQTP